MKKWVAFGDTHFPYTDWEAVGLLNGFLSFWKPDVVLWMGDIFDMRAVNRHDLENRRAKGLEGQRLLEDYRSGWNQLIHPILRRTKRAEHWWVDGNHEAWAYRLEDRIPGLEGLIDPYNVLNLDRYFARYQRQGGFFHLGKLAFCHGDALVRGSSKYCAARAVERYSSSVLIWHFHTRQIWTRETLKNMGFQTGFCVPCLCVLEPYYSLTPINSWVHGFAYGLVEDDGQFHVEVPVIWGGRLFAAGRLFTSHNVSS